MTITRRELFALAGVVALEARSAGAAAHELVVIVHPGVSEAALSDIELEGIFLTLRRFWQGTRTIIPFNLAPRSDVRVAFDQAVLRMDPEDVARYWLDRRVRGGPPPPRVAPDAATLVRLVSRLEGAIGYAPEGAMLQGVRPVARIRGGKVTRP
jgi:hypothetical protein